MTSVSRLLSHLGGVAPRRALLREGASVRAIAAATAGGEIVRVRKGWYALPNLTGDLRRAVRVGGTLTSVSAGPHHRLWTLDDGLLHVAVAPNAGRLRFPDHPDLRLAPKTSSLVCVHWGAPHGDRLAALSPVTETLVHAIECQTAERALTMIDSALNQRIVTLNELQTAVAGRPDRFARVVSWADARCQSGLETLVRVRLQRLGVSVKPQFHRSRVGHVDLLVGDRLVIECDGGTHDQDDQIDRDYDRGIELVVGDFIELHLRYRHVVHEWPRIEAAILSIVRSGRHMWPGRR